MLGSMILPTALGPILVISKMPTAFSTAVLKLPLMF